MSLIEYLQKENILGWDNLRKATRSTIDNQRELRHQSYEIQTTLMR